MIEEAIAEARNLEGFKYLAIDSDGEAFAYKGMPTVKLSNGCWIYEGYPYEFVGVVSVGASLENSFYEL